MKYYVELDDDVADELWRSFAQEGPVSGPTPSSEPLDEAAADETMKGGIPDDTMAYTRNRKD